MKLLMITLLALTSTFALAQKHTSLSRTVNDDEKTLSISVHGTVDGKPLDYERSFDVSKLNTTERNALREHILDSLNISTPEPPKPPVAAVAPTAPESPKPPKAPRFDNNESITIINSEKQTVSSTRGDAQTVAVGGKNPYTKEVNYDPENGRLYVRYRYQKDGEDITYERTLNARDKSQQERDRIIEGIEKEIGLPKNTK
ncbi:hypothetical protein [Spirosoma sp. KNUC1025]|uniref:hypothetical protein n=1 Tax=Spirosoma sp. KNUC1025 TaxID=2894082 RepID=UPI0038639CC6|nr:hypothetical protein LN737_28360 [Spirosoma sp. KNUC1025]